MRRIERAESTLFYYHYEKHGVFETEHTKEDIVSLLRDLRVWCDLKGIDFKECLE